MEKTYTDTNKINEIKELANKIEYKILKTETKGKIFINDGDNWAWENWKENLIESLKDYEKYIVHIESYHGVFLHAMEDFFKEDFDSKITDFIPNNLLKKAKDIYISDFNFTYEWDYNKENGFILNDYVEEEMNENLLDKTVDYFNTLDKLEVTATGYSQGDSVDAVLVFTPKTPKKIKKEIENIFNIFRYLYTITEFSLVVSEEETREYVATGKIEVIESDEDFISITCNDNYLTEKEVEEIKKEYQLNILITE